MSRLCFSFSVALVLTVAAGAPIGSVHAKVTLKTVAEVAKCPALDPSKCAALQSLLNAGPAALPILLEALGSDKQPLRSKAARILGRGEFGPAPDRAAALLGAVSKTGPEIVGETLQALGRVGDPAALPVLTDVLSTDESARNRIFAANALGNFSAAGVDKARQALTKALGDKVPRVQLAAATNLGRIGDASSVVPLINRGLEQITAGFVREAVAMALGRLKDPRALAPLTVLLGNPQPNVRSAAARVLAMLGDKAAVPALMTLAPDDDVVAALVESLSALGDPRGASALLSIAKRSNLKPEERSRALWGLGSLAAPDSVRGVAGLINDRDPTVVRATAECLGRMKHRQGAELVLPLLDHDQESIRKSAVWSLQQITGETFGSDAAAWKRWLAANKAESAGK